METTDYALKNDSQLESKLQSFEYRGFDAPEIAGRQIRVRCSQCEVIGINGHACHETGCPNQRHECRGCNVLVGRGVRYCEDCR